MKNTQKFHLIFLFTFFIIEIKAQEYTVQALGTEQGLHNSYVTDITQDNQGNLWIATEGELSRFYGKEFISYNSHNSALGNNALNTLLYESASNRLWIGTKEGLYTMNCSTKEITPFLLPDSALIDNVVSLSFAPDSSIWITNLYHTIVNYNPRTEESFIISRKNIPELYFSNNCAMDDGKGHLYIGHSHGGMSIIDLKTLEVKNFTHDPKNPHSLPADWINCLYMDRYENIWIGTKKGLALFNPQKEEFTTFYHHPNNKQSLLSDDIYDIQEINENELWIACEIGGISILNLRDLTFNGLNSIYFKNLTVTYDKYGLSSKKVRKVFQDSYGNVWIGNYSKGVDFISRKQPAFHTLPYLVEGGRILTNKPAGGIFADKDEIWVGSENEFALFKHNQLIKIYNLSSQPFSASNSHINTLLKEGDELLLGMSDNGILVFNIKNKQTKRFQLEQDNETTNYFYKDPFGKIWIGAESGLYSYNKGDLQKEKKISQQINNLCVYGIVHDKNGRLWIGSHGDGIFIFNEKNELEHHIKEWHGLSDNSIFHLFKDNQERIWAATREGLSCFEETNHPEAIQSYGYNEGLKDVFIRAISQDYLGRIWVSTTKGLSCLNLQTGTFANYDYHDGIPNGNFNYGSVCAGANGSIYFGSLNGICHFTPHEIESQSIIAPVRIVECLAISDQIEENYSQTLLPEEGKIELDYKKNSFKIIFTVPDFSQSPSIEYAYMIEEISKKWTSTQNENQVTFRNLPPGEYTFKVMARLPNEVWDEEHIAGIKFRIHPPIWLTWYAKILYGLLLIFLIAIWIKFYQRRLKLKSSMELIQKKSKDEQELNQERLRFYTNITHELRTPLTLILGPLEDLTNDSGLPDKYANKIKVIHSSAIRLLNLINQILEFRKTETQNKKLAVSKGNLQHLVTEIGLRFKELNRNENVKFHIHTQEYKDAIFFDSDVVTTIINNLLSNAIKYTNDGEIILSIQHTNENGNDYTDIVVKDTGRGIDKESLPLIFNRYYQTAQTNKVSGTGIGLALVKSLAELHEGSIHVDSSVGIGSTFTFRILTQNSYPSALHKDSSMKLSKDQDESATTPKAGQNGQTIILIIEDNDDIRDYIASSLGNDYQVLTASDGLKGLEIAQQYIPDVIVSDVMMPIMDGFELCQHIKQDVRTSHIPVVLLTAKDSIEDKEKGYECGADSYITKPFSIKLLLSRIHNLQKGRERLASMITQQTSDIHLSTDTSTEEKRNIENTHVSINKLDEEFLNRLTQIVEENLSDKELNIAFLTEKMNMTTSTLYRKIKGLTGLSGNEFIRKYRLQRSLKYMKEEGYNISETAYACGFNDSGYFRNCFKQEFGMTPSEFLKQLHSQNSIEDSNSI